MEQIYDLEDFYYIPEWNLIIEKTISKDNIIDYLNENNIFNKNADKPQAKRLIIGNNYYGTSATLIISNKCNLRCKYCYSCSGNTSNISFMSIETAKIIINKIVNNAILFKSYSIDILFHGGGEPTYNMALLKEIVEYINNICTSNNINSNLYMVTNGVFSNKYCKWLSNNFKIITFSIDGPPIINYSNRPSKNNKDVTLSVINNAKTISELGVKVIINSVITKSTIGYELEMVDYFIKKIPKLSKIKFAKYIPAIDGRNDINIISNDEFMSVFKNAYEHYGDIIDSFVNEFDRTYGYCKGSQLSTIYCHPNKNISTCNQFSNDSSNYQYIVGNVDGEFIIDGNVANLVDIEFKSISKKCKDCFAYKKCGGGCKAAIDNAHNKHDDWCELIRCILIYKMRRKLHNSLYYMQFNYNNSIISVKAVEF